MRWFVRFLTYNNIVPITVSFILLGAASTYAATNPEVLIDKQEMVISIDNTYIANVNFRKYSPTIKILSVTEDNETYFINFEFSTIALSDAVWKDVKTVEVIEISKRTLGRHRDLGLYVTEELNEKLKSEKKRLEETQIFEKKQVSTKKVATKYKGIVGGFLSDKVTTFDKYKPVVKPPKPEKEVQTFARPDPNAKVKPLPKPPEAPVVVAKEVTEEPAASTTVEDTDSEIGDNASSSEETEADDNDVGESDDTEIQNDAPTLTILGDNPVRIAVGETYTDLGAVVTDDLDSDLTVDVYVNGEPVNRVALDTSSATTYSIVYESRDSGGKLAQEERLVEVYSPVQADEGNNPEDTENSDEETGTTTEEAITKESLDTSTIIPTGINRGNNTKDQLSGEGVQTQNETVESE